MHTLILNKVLFSVLRHFLIKCKIMYFFKQVFVASWETKTMKIILVLCCLVLIMGSMTLGKELNKGMNYSSMLHWYLYLPGSKNHSNNLSGKRTISKILDLAYVLEIEKANFILNWHFPANHATFEYINLSLSLVDMMMSTYLRQYKKDKSSDCIKFCADNCKRFGYCLPACVPYCITH